VSAPSVFVLDYPIARPRRLMAALSSIGVEARLTESPLQAKQADVLVVPDGDDADVALEKGISTGVFEAIANHVEAKKPLLCVGLSLCFLLDGQTHTAMPPGLGLFKAPVQRFDPRMTDESERPLLSPHTGQSVVVGLDRHPLLAHLVPKGEAGVWLSFRHRLCAPSRIPAADVAVCHHGVPFAGAVWRDEILAVQFVPEHSSRLGLDLLRAFVSKERA
jgi:glutamine amidotransferase